jgi:hypothetical protein
VPWHRSRQSHHITPIVRKPNIDGEVSSGHAAAPSAISQANGVMRTMQGYEAIHILHKRRLEGVTKEMSSDSIGSSPRCAAGPHHECSPSLSSYANLCLAHDSSLRVQDHDMRVGEIGFPVGAPIGLKPFCRDLHGMPDDPVEACLAQHRLIRGLGPVIVAEMQRATGGEHRHVDGRPLVQGTSDRHAGAVVLDARQLAGYKLGINRERHESPPRLQLFDDRLTHGGQLVSAGRMHQQIRRGH